MARRITRPLIGDGDIHCEITLANGQTVTVSFADPNDVEVSGLDEYVESLLAAATDGYLVAGGGPTPATLSLTSLAEVRDYLEARHDDVTQIVWTWTAIDDPFDEGVPNA